MLSNMELDVEKYVTEFFEQIIGIAPDLLAAILILIFGVIAIRFIMKLINKMFTARHLEVTIAGFLTNLIRWVLNVFLFIVIISKLGIQTTSFVAVLGAAGLAIGLALQGSLANLAGGVLIILFKPFKAGDYISAQGISGTVQGISIFTTTLSTDNNQKALIPNGQLSNEKIINYSALPYRKELMNFGIGYEDDIKKARDIILKQAELHPNIVKEDKPAPKVVVSELGESSVVLQLQYWTKTGDFWPTHWDMLESVKYALDKGGINIPYPQRDIHIIGNENK